MSNKKYGWKYSGSSRDIFYTSNHLNRDYVSIKEVENDIVGEACEDKSIDILELSVKVVRKVKLKRQLCEK